jgi:hypothetical protein
MKINPLGKAIFIFLASYIILLAVFSQFGPHYFKLFGGLFRWQIDLLYPHFKVSSIQMEEYQGSQMVSLTVKLKENMFLADGTVLHSAGRPYTSKTISINEYLHPILIFAILAAWPGIAILDRFKVFLLTLPFLVIVEMLDIPLLLATRCDEVMRANLLHDPLADKRLGSYWAAFLHTGGRAALSIMAAALGLGCFHLWRSRVRMATTVAAIPEKAEAPPAKVGRNDPCPCGSGRKYKSCCGAK